jgi:predicted Zn-dependent protease
LIDQVLAKDQRNEQGLLLKAGVAIDGRQLDQAIADLRTILKDVPNSARALLLLGKAHELAGSPELAQEHYQKAFQAGKQAPQFGMTYGEFLLKRNQAARAESVAEDMVRVAPGNVPAMKLLAQARISKGDWVGAPCWSRARTMRKASRPSSVLTRRPRRKRSPWWRWCVVICWRARTTRRLPF